MGVIGAPGSPRGVLIWGVYKFTGEDVVINSRQEEPFPKVLVRISLTAVSFQLEIDEKLPPPLVWVALEAMGKMAHEPRPGLIYDGLCVRCSHVVLGDFTGVLRQYG